MDHSFNSTEGMKGKMSTPLSPQRCPMPMGSQMVSIPEPSGDIFFQGSLGTFFSDILNVLIFLLFVRWVEGVLSFPVGKYVRYIILNSRGYITFHYIFLQLISSDLVISEILDFFSLGLPINNNINTKILSNDTEVLLSE